MKRVIEVPTQEKGRKTRRSQHMRYHHDLEHHQKEVWYPEQTFSLSDFQSFRNLGTGRPTIQYTACGEYSHWRRECLHDNFCTTCNNHDHATHMCKAPKQTPQQSPATCIYCGSMEHSSIQCRNGDIPLEEYLFI